MNKLGLESHNLVYL